VTPEAENILTLNIDGSSRMSTVERIRRRFEYKEAI
jgi:hypothetical protein